jgi:phage shock protein C
MKKLYLSTSDKKISGVCGGIAAYFSVDPTLIRLLWIVMTIFSGILPGVLAYLIAAIIMPSEPELTPENGKKTRI